MSRPIKLLSSLSIVFAITTVGLAKDAADQSFYLIGNSLTWDTVPPLLDGDVQFHVDCGKPLPFIYAHPQKPCVKQSTLWPTALKSKQYDFVVVQPHYRATLKEDVDTITAWMKLQPQAIFVIHTGWAFSAERANEFDHFTAPTEMTHSPGYIRALIAELRRLHSGREIRQTYAQNLLAQIAADIQADRAPIKHIKELYRDAIHMTRDHGRYMMHNAMRRALGQTPSTSGFGKLDPKLKAYLDGVLTMLDTAEGDRALLREVLSTDESVNRGSFAAKLSDDELKQKVSALLPTIEQAAERHRVQRRLASEIEELGGRLVWTPTAPQWLYLATGDIGTEVFDVIATIDMYNGNNPLKGRGGRNTQVTDAWLAKLSGVTTLKRLDVSNCEIHGDGLKHIAGLTGLREINLTLTPVTDEGLKYLVGLTELRSIGLASSQCNGTGFKHLKALRKLESVNFHFTPLNDAGLRAISQVPIADRFWFAHTHFSDTGAQALKSLSSLKRCGIGSKGKDSSGEAVAALSKLPLEDLSLLDNQASPEGIAHAAKIKTLKRLDVSYAPTVTDVSMKLVAQLPKLEEFRIGGAKLTDTGLMHLTKSRSLKRLTLGRLKDVTEAGVAELKKARPELNIEVR